MIQPPELKKELPVELSNGVISTTTQVWNILVASKNGDTNTVKQLVEECHELIYAQYNYSPPIHFAVREGHIDLVKYLLDNGAHDSAYKIYPFQESLQTIAQDRAHHEIVEMLDQYVAATDVQKFKGDNGRIIYNRGDLETEFEEAVHANDLEKTKQILKEHPEFTKDETYFWGEGILLFAAKENHRPMIDLLMSYGAKVPAILKWTQFYYFEDYDGASYLMDKGMNPNTMSCHHVTILHDMAQKGNIRKAELLIKHGAEIDPIDEEYQSTPLGMASRWGQLEMAAYLIEQGADVNRAGAPWATPLSWARKKGHNEMEELLRYAGATR